MDTKKCLKKMTVADKARLLCGTTPFSIGGFESAAGFIPELNMQDGGTGINFEHLFGHCLVDETIDKRFTLEELRERLDADTASYKKNYGLFKKYVLEPALKDIETSDLRVSYIEIKEGRKVVAIDFVITEDVMAYYERGLLDSGK